MRFGLSGTPIRRPIVALVGLMTLAGCGHKEESHYQSAAEPPAIRVVRPELRTITREVGQPSFVEAYERTSIYPKMTAYIQMWVVDIGDRVKKGQTLATLFVPELVEDLGTKRATVTLDEQRVEMARKIVDVSAADVTAAEARLAEARSILAKYQSDADRWESQVKRLTREVSRGVVDPQVLLESTNQFRSSGADRDAADATIRKAEAELLSYQAKLSKSRVDVSVADAALGVARSEARRLEAWNGYLTLSAPFDGVIADRNANTGDFVLPATGDPTAESRSPYRSPSGNAAPIYVVDRTDVVRVFVDVPEADANYVHTGTSASVLVRGFRDEPIPGAVTRTSWALNIKSRTLRAEIDLPNPGSQLLPGMYAYAKVVIERPGVRSLPSEALAHVGDQTFCYLYEDGKSKRAEVRIGVTDGEHVEVVSLGSTDDQDSDMHWKPLDGSERVILGDLTLLTDGGKVEIKDDKPASGQGDKNPPTAARAAEPPGHRVARRD